MNFLIRRKITLCMLFTGLTLLGYLSYKQLPVELLPNAELPLIYIQVSSQQETDPSYMESQVIIPLEGAVSTIGGIEKIESDIHTNQASIRVDFKKNVHFKITQLKLQEKINELTPTLPEGITVTIQKVDLNQLNNTFLSLQVRGSGGTDRIRNIVENDIRPELENITGVASLAVYGGRQKAIEIRINEDAAQALNLTPAKISALLAQNTKEKTFAGFVHEARNRYFVQVDAVYNRISEIENIIVAPGPILLKDIATVFFDKKEETSYSRVNGKETVSVSVLNDSQANLIELSHRVVAAIDKLNRKFASQEIEIVVQTNTAEVMEKNISQIIHLALTGGLLAILILWFFLKNVRLVFFIALSIPISIYTAFNFFYASGISINSLTLVGIALAIGMLLDNSIVVLENIYRLSGSGKMPEAAAVQGTREVRRSILAATLTTITVFLPFVFSDNFLIKLVGRHIGVSIISTLTVSLFVALLFIPMVTYTVLRKEKGQSRFYEKLSIRQRAVQIYLVLLKSGMRHPGITISAAVILLFAVLILSLTLNIQEVKEIESDRFTLAVDMPAGSTLEMTDNVVRTVEERLDKLPEKKDLVCRIRETDAVLTLILKENYKTIGKRDLSAIKEEVRKLTTRIKDGVTIAFPETGNGAGSGTGMEGMGNLMRLLGIGNQQECILIKGNDTDALQKTGDDLRAYLNELDFVTGARLSAGYKQPEIHLRFDPVLLATYDIARTGIAASLTGSHTELSSGTSLKIGNESYDILIRNKPTVREETETKKTVRTTSDLRSVWIPDAAGSLHRLEELASFSYSRGNAEIKRVNQEKHLQLTYRFARESHASKEVLNSYRSEIDQLITNYKLPAGVVAEAVHEQDLFADFKFLILAAVLLIFMILASVFESVLTPFVLLFTVPLAATGSLLALLLTGNSLLNANTLTGFLILLGVVVNNGILLIDYSHLQRKQGNRRTRALITAGLSRIRPILITSITTIIALFPLATGKSEYAGAIGAPFAITVIGGLGFSALLTLVLIPTVYVGLENLLSWYRTLPHTLHGLHTALFLTGCYLIYFYIDGILWQSVYLTLLFALIPGVTYFARSSLRRARIRLIVPGEEIHISLRNVVKIYGRPSRFIRQWNSGTQLRKRFGADTGMQSLKDFAATAWQFALAGFGIYFTYFFISNKVWIFVLSLGIYAATLHLWSLVKEYLFSRFPGNRKISILDRIFFWGIPLLTWFALWKKLDHPAISAVIAFLWTAAMLIYLTSRYLYTREINIERIKGKFAGLRRSYFRMVSSIPFIGKRQRPFKALRGISLEIKTGMFGLLGPNGAGKSTLMRIICGIFSQSYGSIRINGLDTRIYREELQSLIGYLPQEFGMYETLSAWEFLDYQALLKGISEKETRKARVEYVLQAVHMYDRKEEKISAFSGGMKQRIGIALILLHLPRILVVDEPTAGLDPRERIRFRNLLVELSRERVVIFSTHIIEDISSSCNQIAVVNKGELKYAGHPAGMVGMAHGKVWQFTIDKEAFEKELDKSLVVRHIQQGKDILVRYLSEKTPYPNALPVEANLEDAYLCLLKSKL